MNKWALTAVSITLAATVVACAKSPTGRNQLLLFSSNELNQMGEQSYAQMKEEEKISTDAELNNYVQCITDDLVATLPANYRDMNWEVTVFESDQVNAFALPGGHIGVYRGLHEVAETPSQLAAVIGHEIGHVIAEHGNARMSSNMLIGLGLSASSLLAAQQTDDDTAAMIMAGLGIGAQVGIALPYSRSHESESDQLGMDYMAEAGYNPADAADLWRNMAAESGGENPPEFLSTHPSPNSRIDAINAYLPQVNPIYQQRVSSGNAADCQRPSD